MGHPLRRYPEDSVVVSIGQVRDMLRSDATPPAKQGPERAVPMAIPIAPPGQVVDSVPSAAEVAAEREARWNDEALPSVAGPVRRPLWQRHGWEIGLAVSGLVAGVLLAMLFAGPEVPPEIEAQLAEQTKSIAALQADLDSARAETMTARGELTALAAHEDDLTKQVAALEAEKAEREKKTAEAENRRTRRGVNRAPTGASRPGARSRRRAPRLTKVDRKLDSLLDGL